MKDQTTPFESLGKDLCLTLLASLPTKDRQNLMKAVPTFWRTFNRSQPRVLLKHAQEDHEYLRPEPKDLVCLTLPKKPPYDPAVASDCFISQMRNETLVCCYPDGVIGLINRHQPQENPRYLPLLPAVKTVRVHELADQQLIVALENNETYFVNLHTQAVLQLNLTASDLQCVLSRDAKTMWVGMKRGRLIEWDLEQNLLKREWYFTARKGQEKLKNIKEYQPHITTEIEAGDYVGHDVLCVARNIDEKLFLVLDIYGGYLTGLFDPQTQGFVMAGRHAFPPCFKLGNEPNRVVFNRYGGIDVLYNNTMSNDLLEVSTLNLITASRTLASNRLKTLSAFVLPNGDLSFYSVNDDESDNDNSDELPESEFVLEIMKY